MIGILRPVSRALVAVFLVILAIRTRQLARDVDDVLDTMEIREQLEQQVVGMDNMPVPQSFIQNFLAAVERLDGLAASLRLLLTAALTFQKGYDDDYSPSKIQQRCQRYELDVSNRSKPRRIFSGSLLADDSWHTLGAAAMEYHGLFHTIAFVESNTTQTGATRYLRFASGSERHRLIVDRRLWGAKTRVHVDTFYPRDQKLNGLGRENAQRNQILKRWKQNGMRYDDIGFLSDADEIATRDFLLALQTCEVPEFRSPPTGHDCIKPKLSSSTLSYEGSPKCLQLPRRIVRPDWILGECIEGIGNSALHPPVPRSSQSSSAERIRGWRKRVGNVTDPTTNRTTFVNGPLWDATDMRMITTRPILGTTTLGLRKQLHTAVHLHNFFDSLAVLRNKYETYGHPRPNASNIPLSEIQRNDIGFMVDCLTGNHGASGSKWSHAAPADSQWIDSVVGKLAAFRVPGYVNTRHSEWQHELALDEVVHPKATRNISSSVKGRIRHFE
jgi:hypothetical protein